MQEYPEGIIITVDDDIAYPPDLVETLIAAYDKHPGCVCARRVHRMTYNDDGTLKPYNEWQFECTTVHLPDDNLIATGVGGVLYPPHIFDNQVFDIGNIKNLCLDADDIWLKWHELRLGIKVVYAENSMPHPPIVGGSQTTSLCSENVINHQNDTFINRMQENVYNYHK